MKTTRYELKARRFYLIYLHQERSQSRSLKSKGCIRTVVEFKTIATYKKMKKIKNKNNERTKNNINSNRFIKTSHIVLYIDVKRKERVTK